MSDLLRNASLVAVLVAASLMLGCETVYYGAWEQLGYEKRDLFVSAVQDASDSQQKAKEEFQDALDEFLAVTGAEGGELESKYRQLKSQFEASEAAAGRVSQRVDDVQSVAEALFREWEGELEQYETAELRRASEKTLLDTRSNYNGLISAMRRTEAKMGPILAKFRDNVLFLKHNLNAQAVASLSGISEDLKVDVSNLIRDMEASIAEAEAFISQVKQ